MRAIIKILTAGYFILGLFTLLAAQQSKFSKVYIDTTNDIRSYSIVKTFDNNYIIAGMKDDYGGLIIKIDTAGNILWNKIISNGNNDVFDNIILTNDSCFLLVGNTYNTDSSKYYILCVKINSNGDILWTKFINTNLNFQNPVFVQQTKDKGFIITGGEYVVKLNSSGNIEWSNILIRGINYNVAYSVKQTPDSGYVITGYTENDSIYEYDAFLVEVTSKGIISWSKKYAMTDGSFISGYDIIVNANSLLCLLQSENQGTTIIKTDLSGNVIWCKNYPYLWGGQGSNYLSRSRLQNTSDSSFIFISGSSCGQESIFVKIDSEGIVKWSNRLFLLSTEVIETKDKGFIIVGNGPICGDKKDQYNYRRIGIIKADKNGNGLICIDSTYKFSVDTLTLNVKPFAVSTSTGGTTNSLHPTVTSALLLVADSACVGISGDIKENKPKENTLLIYPNPVNSMLVVSYQLPENSSVNICIYDITGREVWAIVTNGHQQGALVTNERQQFINVNTQQFGDGVYILKFSSNGFVETKKMVVSH